ncbi:hypothetical protein TrST_g7281 [Triparma strigata]|uniref:VWFA domain-containing protein n=1 Tax=Triparma strigata TaxID=1606541 RepID=A0A9W7AG75_9STRA|nr:hypothetical protein TrST_g7281 [Triparma strigata]
MAQEKEVIGVTERVQRMQQELDLPEETVRDLLTCAGMNILVLADDSSSMQAVSCTSDVYAPQTRWDELKVTLEKLVTMMLVVDHAGFELKFFNDPEWFDINTVQDLKELFLKKPTPKGMTPLAANLQLVLSSSYSRGDFPEGDTLVLVLTDGQPSDTNMAGLQRLVDNRAPKVWVSFVMCTEEDSVVDSYDKIIDPLKGVDICDDYTSEKATCAKKKNDLSYNMYLVKCLLGSRMDKYGHLDSHKPDSEGGCCTLS